MTRVRLLVALAVVSLLAAAGAWLGFGIWTTAGLARDLDSAIASAQDSIGRLDTSAAAADLQRTSEAAARLAEGTQGTAWSLAERLPLIGESARAASTFALAADTLATAALPLFASIDNEASSIGKVMAVLAAEPEVAGLRDAAAQVEQDLAAVSPDGLHFGLAEALTRAQESLPAVVDTLDGVLEAAGPLRSMLGGDKPRTWLVMSQNPAELRGTGGLFNAYLIVTVDDGNLTIVEANSRKVLDTEFPRTEQIPYWGIVGFDTAGTWGPILGEWASFNIPADFPAVARMASAGMAQRGTPVDGVVAIDPTVIAAILAGTGPVEHKGVTISAADAYDFFTARVYEDFPGFADVAAKDQLGMGLTYATIDAATKRPLDARPLLTALGDAVAGGHVRVWSSDTEDEAWLLTTPVSGSFNHDLGQTVVGFANGTGGKLDPYVTRDVVIDASRCESDGVIDVSVSMANDAPENLPQYVDVTLDQDGQPDPSVPSGFTRTYVSVYAPGTTLEDASSLVSATRDGEPFEPSYGSTEGRPTWTTTVELERGQETQLQLQLRSLLCPAPAS